MLNANTSIIFLKIVKMRFFLLENNLTSRKNIFENFIFENFALICFKKFNNNIYFYNLSVNIFLNTFRFILFTFSIFFFTIINALLNSSSFPIYYNITNLFIAFQYSKFSFIKLITINF